MYIFHKKIGNCNRKTFFINFMKKKILRNKACKINIFWYTI